MNDPDDAQLELGLEVREPVPAPRWAEALDQEVEGNQDRGWWGA